ncbi:MAG: hypothetical protein Q7U34_14790 [Anaerolineales bacterium]|nr:hypothetical protein [Anaerolineales bacterium]
MVKTFCLPCLHLTQAQVAVRPGDMDKHPGLARHIVPMSLREGRRKKHGFFYRFSAEGLLGNPWTNHGKSQRA